MTQQITTALLRLPISEQLLLCPTHSAPQQYQRCLTTREYTNYANGTMHLGLWLLAQVPAARP